MVVKAFIKRAITLFKAKANRLTLVGGGNYIGMDVKFVNRGKVELRGNVTIRPSSHLYANVHGSEITLGEGTEIGNHSTISSYNKVVFGKDVLTGSHVFVTDHNHEYADPDVPIHRQGVRCGEGDEVVIGEGSWIGTNAVIVGNVRIGRHCVIGANSVVTKDIPDCSVAVGIPARVVKRYDSLTGEWRKVAKACTSPRGEDPGAPAPVCSDRREQRQTGME